MIILSSAAELQKFRQNIAADKTLGFVPTMGALHAGHISLVDIAASQSDVVIVSIFVNPTQFNDPEDLKKYPRNVKADLEMLSKTTVDAVFIPEVKDIYPVPDKRVFNFGYIEQVMEGAHRPGHFNGVAQVVSKLFDLVMPDKAFFGMKDFQQLAIIKSLVKKFDYPIEIVPCPIIREADGLAMSSRNVLLNAEQRSNAAQIFKVLSEAKLKQHTFSVAELKEWVVKTLNSNPHMAVEYFEIVDDENLTEIKSWKDKGDKIACIAVKIAKIRLIDNINFS
jgi:pantoate--beta-alanine ligase